MEVLLWWCCWSVLPDDGAQKSSQKTIIIPFELSSLWGHARSMLVVVVNAERTNEEAPKNDLCHAWPSLCSIEIFIDSFDSRTKKALLFIFYPHRHSSFWRRTRDFGEKCQTLLHKSLNVWIEIVVLLLSATSCSEIRR